MSKRMPISYTPASWTDRPGTPPDAAYDHARATNCHGGPVGGRGAHGLRHVLPLALSWWASWRDPPAFRSVPPAADRVAEPARVGRHLLIPHHQRGRADRGGRAERGAGQHDAVRTKGCAVEHVHLVQPHQPVVEQMR